MALRLRITKRDDKHLLLEALVPVYNFGFGTFLLELKPEEIHVDKFSMEAMLAAREIRGLAGMEIWDDYKIAWGDPEQKIIMPIKEISKQPGAENWLKKVKTQP